MINNLDSLFKTREKLLTVVVIKIDLNEREVG
jgi:hypothetical protein